MEQTQASQPEAAATPAEQRATLMRDAGFRERYIAGDSSARQQMEALDRAMIGATNPRPEAPIAVTPQKPAPLTQEGARQRIAELRSDRSFAQRFANGDAEARREMDALHRAAAGMQPEQPQRQFVSDEEFLQAAAQKDLAPPASPDGYRIAPTDPVTGFPMELDTETKSLVSGTLLPAAHRLGLSQGNVSIIADAVTRPMSFEKCEATLKAVWGSNFDAGIADFKKAVSNPKDRELLEAYPDTLGNNAPLIVAIVDAYRRRTGR